MADQPQFFNQWEAPPGYAPPPASDDALVQRVSKLVEFAARNGPSFVELIKKKQKVRETRNHDNHSCTRTAPFVCKFTSPRPPPPLRN